jgi:hypothetical protein
MKTVASSTKNESTDLVKLKAAIAATATYINQWTEHEVNSISIRDRMPYIYPIDNLGFIIGHYRILNNKGEWQVRTADKLIHSFTEKLSAIFYVLCELTKRYKLSNNLLLADKTVGRLRNDMVHYEASVKRAKVNKDYDRADIWTARLQDATVQLQMANTELRKSLNTAKYIKYWE